VRGAGRRAEVRAVGQDAHGSRQGGSPISFIEAVVLGLVQGLTEFLPISSTAHLRIVPAFLGWDDPGAAFTAVIQLGTVLAVLIYFREDLWRITRAWLRSLRQPALRRELDARMGWYIIVATIPIGVFGFLFRHQIETGARSLYLMGTTLIVLGLVLLAAEAVGTRRRALTSVRAPDAIVVGFAQALALIPGVSRSGATITGGLFLGLQREAAARFSFLLSVPAIVLSGLFEMRLIFDEDSGTGIGALLVATAVAFAVGYASIAFLLRFLGSHSTGVFVAYRVVLGAVVLVLAASGVIS
jgi:undecaprenyl-diphosphatase